MRYYDVQMNHKRNTYGDGRYGCRPYTPPQAVNEYDRGYDAGKMTATTVVGTALFYFIMKALKAK